MKDIRLIELPELQEFVKQEGESAFRAKQIMEWVWKKNVPDFDAMSNIPQKLREKLSQSFVLQKMVVVKEQKSRDGCTKYLLQLFDNHLVEMVLIPAKDRVTVCVSSQSGCPLGCVFCATATMGFYRNLFAHEIYEQVFLANELSQERHNHKISNIVLMGMGEPLLNLENVMKAIQKLTDRQIMGFSPSRITLSTAGICEKIKTLAEANLRINLAVSLHTANQVKRKSLMPIAIANPLEQLSQALCYFHEKTGERITFEYLMLEGINDSLQDAQELALFCRSFPVKINIIPYNPTDKSEFRPAGEEKIEEFVQFLESKNMLVQVRRSRGKDIDAACGQLRSRE